MPIRDWFRPPRHVLTIFLAVALISGATLTILGWLLLQQDAALETQRRQERLELAASRAVVVMQRALADLERQSSPGVIRFTPGSRLLYHPILPNPPATPPNTFDEAEKLEFSANNAAAAIVIYTRLAANAQPAIRAGALFRLARLHRKLRNTAAALAAYQQLAQKPDITVEGLPAGLLARVGRASLFEESQRPHDLKSEAAALAAELNNGRWPLLLSAYTFHTELVRGWLPDAPPPTPVARARAEAAAWLWLNRHKSDGPDRRLIHAAGQPVLLIWDAANAIIAGPDYLEALAREAMPDADLRLSMGVPPPTGQSAIRDAATAKLPWTLHVSNGTPVTANSTRQRLLLLVFGVLAAVLLAGTYFITRAISRELRVARLQSDFVAAVSHEFRSPLSSLCQISEMLSQDRFPSEDLRRKSYTVLERESTRLRGLVENVLDFGRFEAGAYGYRFERLEWNAFVADTAKAFEAKVSVDGFHVEKSGNAPPEAYVQADREALTRALWNLLDNAVKYSPDCRTVWVELGRDGANVTVTIRDQGIGIPLNEQREIFNKFVRGAESKARSIKGTGIGLAMVREIVRAHGGQIRVVSEPGQGSRFTMEMRTTGAPS